MGDTVNASIPLSGNTQGFDVSKMLSLADMAQQMRMNQTKMQQQNALTQLIANPGSYNQDGSVNQNALRMITAANPEIGITLKNQNIQEQLRKTQEQHYASEDGRARFDFMSGIAGTAYDAYTEAKKTGADEQGAIAAATKARNAALDASGGMISDQQIQAAKGTPYDPLQSKAFASMNKEWIAGQRAQSVAEMAGRKADQVDRAEAERVRHDMAVEDRLSKGGSGKAPAGFEWDPEKPDTLRPIAGGPKDPNSKPWSGREKVYAERIMGSAREASADLANIVELPVGASTGMLGIGGHAGTSIIGTSFGALKNAMSTQEVQDYNVMISGIQRNLSAIESMGLAPSGSLTSQMESVVIKPGDTELTKLRRLAQTRQIIEKGLDTPLSDPAIPDVMKAAMRETIETTRKAVPFSNHDITEFEKKSAKDPKITLQDVMKKTGLSDDNKGTVSGKIDRPDKKSAPPTTNAKGWALHKDANGNMAYVGPNNEIEVVK